MKKSIIFSCGDVAIRINSVEEIIDYLVEMFSDYYEISSDADFCIDINYIIGIPKKFLYADKELNDVSYNYIDGNDTRLDIYLPYYNESKKSFVKRIFTTSFVKAFQKKNYMILHGACAFKDNKGIIITGDAGSGKTTLLQKLLNHGYGYVANDRLAIKKYNNEVIVCGIPFSMGIRNKDIIKDLDGYSSYYIDEIDKMFLENKDVPKYFLIDMKSRIDLSTIIFCSYDINKKESIIKQVSDINESIYHNIMFDNSIPTTKNYLNSLFGSYKKVCDLSSINGIEIIQGLNSEKEIINEIEKIMIKKKGN